MFATLLRLTEKRIVSNVRWTFTGNALYAASQWAMIVILARYMDPQTVGTFALAFAITAPVMIFFNMQLRAVEATDVTGKYAFREYFQTRVITTSAALLITLLILVLLHENRSTLLVIVLIALSKATESLSDVIHGYWQLGERMELVGKSLSIRALLTLGTFTFGIATTRNLMWGSGAFLAGSLGVLFFFDMRWAGRLGQSNAVAPSGLATFLSLRTTTAARVGSMIRVVLPLGVAAMLISLNTAIPRYFVERHWGKQALGIFAALSYFIVVGNMCMNAVGQSILPRLARSYRLASRTEFRQLFAALLVCAGGVAAASMGVSLLFGRRLLLIYGKEYAEAYPVFLIIMSAASIGYVLSILNFSLNAVGAYNVQMPLFLSVTLLLIVLCWTVVPRYGIRGAGIALVASSGVQAVLSAMCLGFEVRRSRSTVDA